MYYQHNPLDKKCTTGKLDIQLLEFAFPLKLNLELK